MTDQTEELVALLRNDGFAATFVSISDYRAALLQFAPTACAACEQKDRELAVSQSLLDLADALRNRNVSLPAAAGNDVIDLAAA